MASELSQFIEKEFRTQDVNEDEQKRLLDELRAEPLPSVPPPFYKTGTFKKVMIAVAVLTVVALAIVGASFRGGIHSSSPGLWNAGKVADSPGPSQAVINTSHKGATEHDKGKGETNDEDAEKKEKKKKEEGKKKEKDPAPPPEDRTVEGVGKVEKEDEDDVEDYVGEDSERPKFDEEGQAYEDYEKAIEKMEEERQSKQGPTKHDKDDQSGEGDAGKLPRVIETAREADQFDLDYAADDVDYGGMVRDPVTPDKE